MPTSDHSPADAVREPKPPFPVQHQTPPGSEAALDPQPRYQAPLYRPAGKLAGKAALITGGDSGIGRAVAVMYAAEGADVAIAYLPSEEEDARVTQREVEARQRRCVLLPCDLAQPQASRLLVEQTVAAFGRIDILVSNAARQTRKPTLDAMSDEEIEATFQVNVYACLRLTREAVPHMREGAAIVVTSSETGLLGSEMLPDYSATKGALNTYVKALAPRLAKQGIRVNAVAPGPVWTPLNPADPGLPPDKVATFGSANPMGRPAQPEEVAPAYVFLASSADSSYVTGIVLPVMGGETVGG